MQTSPQNEGKRDEAADEMIPQEATSVPASTSPRQGVVPECVASLSVKGSVLEPEEEGNVAIYKSNRTIISIHYKGAASTTSNHQDSSSCSVDHEIVTEGKTIPYV